MPIWKVSLTDGMFQVADADGALYPLTMGAEPITRFNEGWSPRGLQTGLPPLHVLELEHDSGDSTIWLHDETLDYRANAVPGLGGDDQTRFFAHMDPIIRTLYTECVLAAQAAIPSVAHQFDGMLPRTVWLLVSDTIHRTMPNSDLVVLDALQELGAGYGSGVDTLSADWIARSIEAPAGAAQDRFDLPGRQCDRHLDPASGRVFYVMRNGNDAETSLFVPSARVVFVRGHKSHDPLHLLLLYYAGNTNRAVSLPELADLSPEMVVPPQHGLDEPPQPAGPPDSAADAPGHARTVFEAPLGETPHVHDLPPVEPVERELDPSSPALPDRTDHPDLPPVHAPAAMAPPAPAPQIVIDHPAIPASMTAPRQNWWQRLLGLGNP